MRYRTTARGRVFLATVAFLIFGAIGCESVVAPEVRSGDRAVATGDQSDQEAGRADSGNDSQETWEPHRTPRTDKYREE